MQARKARAAMILKQSFPYVPFIEAKARGVRFRDFTRGVQGAIRLSTAESLERAAAAATAASSTTKAPPLLLRPTISPPQRPQKPPAAAPAPAVAAPAPVAVMLPPAVQEAPAKKRAPLTPVPVAPVSGTPEKPLGGAAVAFPPPGAAAAGTVPPSPFGTATPAPATAASAFIPTAPLAFGKPPPTPEQQRKQQEQRPEKERGEEDDEGRTRKRRVGPSVVPSAPAPAPALVPVAAQQQQPAPPSLAFPPLAWPPQPPSTTAGPSVPSKEPAAVQPAAPGPAPPAGGLLGTLGKWMGRAASGVRALTGEARRANQKRLDEAAQRLKGAARGRRLRAAFGALHDAAARAAWRRRALRVGVERLGKVVARARRRLAFQHWGALVERERALERAERARFEASLQKPLEQQLEAMAVGAAAPVKALELAVREAPPEQAAAARKRRRQRRSSIAGLVAGGGRLPPVKPLDLPQLVGPTLWRRHEERFAALLNPGRDPPPPALMAWKLVVEATEQDPAGAWLLGALTLEASGGPATTKQRPLWLAEYRLEAGSSSSKAAAGRGGGRGKKKAAATAAQPESAMDLALCVKRAGASAEPPPPQQQQQQQQQPEAAHALLVHLPEPSYTAALHGGGGGGGDSDEYWAAQCGRLRACVAGVTPGAPLLLCLGPEAIAALSVDDETPLDVRQRVARRLGLGQRGFTDAAAEEDDDDAEAETVGFDWEVLPLPDGLGRGPAAAAAARAAEEEVRQAVGDGLVFLAEAAPTAPLVVRETLVVLVGDAVQSALWGPAADEAWAVTAEACRRAANAAVAAVRARLCAQEVAAAPWPIPELAPAAGTAVGAASAVVVPRALWWDATAAAAGSRRSNALTVAGLPVGWNALPRLLRLEALLRAVELPPLPAEEGGEAGARDPVVWVERYLQALQTDAAASGWSPGVSPSLVQFARGLALAAREQWGRVASSSSSSSAEAPWNRLFGAFVVDRVTLALQAASSNGSGTSSSSKDPLALSWAYRLHTSPTPEPAAAAAAEAKRGTALREYLEMDLDEGHREMVGVVRNGNGRRVSFACLLDPNAVPVAAGRTNRRRRRRRRPSYALDLPAMMMEGLRLEDGEGEEEGELEGLYYVDDEASVGAGGGGSGGGPPSLAGGSGRGGPHHKRARRQLRTPQPQELELEPQPPHQQEQQVVSAEDREAAETRRAEAAAEAYLAASAGGQQEQQQAAAWAASVGSLTNELAKEAQAWGSTADFLKTFM